MQINPEHSAGRGNPHVCVLLFSVVDVWEWSEPLLLQTSLIFPSQRTISSISWTAAVFPLLSAHTKTYTERLFTLTCNLFEPSPLCWASKTPRWNQWVQQQLRERTEAERRTETTSRKANLKDDAGLCRKEERFLTDWSLICCRFSIDLVRLSKTHCRHRPAGSHTGRKQAKRLEKCFPLKWNHLRTAEAVGPSQPQPQKSRYGDDEWSTLQWIYDGRQKWDKEERKAPAVFSRTGSKLRIKAEKNALHDVNQRLAVAGAVFPHLKKKTTFLDTWF